MPETVECSRPSELCEPAQQSVRRCTGAVGAGTIYNLVARAAFLVGGYGLHIGLARVLGPTAYGTIGVVLPLTTIARVLVNGPRQAISKLTAEHVDQAAAIRRAALLIEGLFSMAVLVAMVAGAGLIAGLLRDPSLAVYIRLMAPMVPAMALLSVYLASLNGQHAFGRQSLVSVIYGVGRPVLGIAGAWLWGLPGAILGLVACPMLALGVAHLLLPAARKEGRFPLRRLVAFSLPMMVFAVSDSLLMYVDLLFVKSIVRDGTQVGYYAAAATVAQVPYYALLALADTLLPVTASLVAQGQREQARRTIAQGMRYGLMLLLPAGALITATAQPLMALFYGRAFAPAGPVLAILIWGQTFYAFVSVLTAVLIAEDQHRQAMLLALGLLPVSALLNLLLVPRFGLLGAACSTAAATLLGTIVSWELVRRRFGAIVEVGSAGVIAAVAALCGALALWWRPRGLLLVPAYVALWGLDLLLLWLLGEVKPADVQRLMRLLGRAAA